MEYVDIFIYTSLVPRTVRKIGEKGPIFQTGSNISNGPRKIH